MAVITVENLRHVYSAGTPFEKVAIEDINLSVPQGQLLGVIGHTGSGKSTFIQHLNALLRPNEGCVLCDGEDINKDKLSRRDIKWKVGLVFQYPEYQLFEDTVYKDISFGPKNMGLKEAEIKERVLRAADFAGVDRELLDKSPFDLSGGQKRRVAIAGVIAMEPEIIIFDEPTAGLDPAGCAALLENIRSYQKATGATIMMVSHSMDDVAALADRLLVLYKGKIEMLGKPAEVFAKAERLREIGLTVPQVTSLFLRLRQLGIDVDPATYTFDHALKQLLSLKGGAGNA